MRGGSLHTRTSRPTAAAAASRALGLVGLPVLDYRRSSCHLYPRLASSMLFSTSNKACASRSTDIGSSRHVTCTRSSISKPLHRHGSLLLKSRDTLGIVSAVSDVVLKHGCNMTGADVHVEKGRKRKRVTSTTCSSSGNKMEHESHSTCSDDDEDTFVCRFSFETDGSSAIIDYNDAGGGGGSSRNSRSFAFNDADSAESFNLQSFEEHVMEVVINFHAEATLLHQSGRLVYFNGGARILSHQQQQQQQHLSQRQPQKVVLRPSGPARMAVFASSRDHCLNDLIDKCRGGDLPVQISYVVSNYLRTEENSHVYRALSRLNVPYHYVQCGKGRLREEWEANIRSIIQQKDGTVAAETTVSAPPPPPSARDNSNNNQTDFIVLARFMQILSPEFLSWYAPRPIINIHHGLLPSFKGSNPYRQAFDAGVKLIGATAHFVTDELDEGPIIEQRATCVSHRDSVRDVRIKSETLEANALHDAVRYVAENRVARVGGRTIVFT
mmetsp:Transcript_1919/g.4215  ORF Transcript_1919/g.4215 Transcript_1919/m.4215 type:complete len:497 (+) Transcript_1919:74-1564(+)